MTQEMNIRLERIGTLKRDPQAAKPRRGASVPSLPYCPPLSILNLHRGNILRVIADGDSRIGQLKRAASCGHKVAERDAEVDFLDIPACFRGLDQRALFVEMIGAVSPDDTPWLHIGGRRGPPHRFQKWVLRLQRRVEILVVEELRGREPFVAMDFGAQSGVHLRAFGGRISQRAGYHHEFICLRAGRAFEKRTVHRAADPGGAQAEGPCMQDHQLEGEAKGLFTMRGLRDFCGDVQVLSPDHGAGQAVRLCVEQHEFNRNSIRVGYSL